MNLVIKPSASISGEVEAPPSKLHTQFSAALAILTGGKSTIESPLRVRDTNVMLKAAESLGATVKRAKERWSIWGVDGEIKSDKNMIDAKNSGTAMSILTAISTLSLTSIVLNGDAQLRSRPMPVFLKTLRSLGTEVYSTKPNDSPPFMVFGGGMAGGKISIGSLETRYLPAILIAAPYAKKKVELKLKVEPLDPVSELMKIGRVKVVEKRNTISVPKQPYRVFSYRVPQEVAGTAPFMTAACLTNSKIKVTHSREMTKRDKEFLNYLKSFGILPHASRKSVNLEGGHKLKAAKLNLSSAPEFLPMFAVIACLAKGKTLLHGVAGARTMKSDRISAITNELRRMRGRLLERSDGLLIQGPVKLKGREVDGHNDYAITAALAVAGLIADDKTTIKNAADSLSSTYSRFISTFQTLGAEISYGR
ncbi:MAG: hypothetical protein ABH852_05540 [Methanobacteriota archaeon]